MSLTKLAVIAALTLGVPAAPAAAHWVPPTHLTWYWQLQGSVKVEPVMATDMDAFDNTAATVAKFHALGQKVIAYIDVGTWENWRPDAGSFPASVKGRSNGWPGEKWLDIRQLSILQPIMAARMNMAKAKGFDAIEPDNMDGWENETGFPITAAQQLTYNEWIANYAHSIGLTVFQKNDPEQATTLQPYFDGILDEQAIQYNEANLLQPYLAADKPVLDAEYKSSLFAKMTAYDVAHGIMGALFDTALDGTVYRVTW